MRSRARSVSLGARAKSPSNDATRASTSEMHTRWMALANQMKEAPKAIQNLKRAKSVEQRKTAEEHIKEVFDLVKREQVEAESAAKKAKRDLALIARKAADEEVRQKFLREKAALEEASKNAMNMVKAVSSELAVAVKDASKREQAPSRSKKEPEPASSQVLALEDDNKRRPTRGRSSSPVNKSRKKKDQPLAIQDAPPKRAPSRRKKELSTPPVIALEDDASRRRAPSTGRSRSPAKPERERRGQMLAIADVAKMPPAEQALQIMPRDPETIYETIKARIAALQEEANITNQKESNYKQKKGESKRINSEIQALLKEKKKLENQYARHVSKGRKGGSMNKRVQHNPVVEYHDLADDPYVMKPRLRIPEKTTEMNFLV